MRVPSLLNTTAVNLSALVEDCGGDRAGLLLACSMLAPVCLDRPIWPCRALCRNVTGTCRRHAAVDCDALPDDDQLCLGPSSTTTGRGLMTTAGGRVSQTAAAETLLDTARLQRRQRKKTG